MLKRWFQIMDITKIAFLGMNLTSKPHVYKNVNTNYNLK